MIKQKKEWLAPLPDRSLPNIKIREILINTLQEVNYKTRERRYLLL